MSPSVPIRQTALGYANEGYTSVVSPYEQVRSQQLIAQVHPSQPGSKEQPLPSLAGQVILSGKYILTKKIPVASPKCEIYEALPLIDGRAQESKPLIVKLSSLIDEGIDQELANYRRLLGSGTLSSKKKAQHLFIKVYDAVPSSSWTRHQAGFVMEKGKCNLRSFIRRNGAYRGEALRSAMFRIIQCVDVLHSQGLVWTELKPENFVVMDNEGMNIKGIDLESLVPMNGHLKVYTAESCPPEFPIEEMYKSLPRMRVSPEFDIWGLGLVLFEMATGKPLYAKGITDLEYIKHKLRHIDETMHDLETKLQRVEPAVADLIMQCLQIRPCDRASTEELLRHGYFKSASFVKKPTTRELVDESFEELEQGSFQSILHARHERNHPKGKNVKQPNRWQQVQRSPSRVSYAASSHRVSTALNTASATKEYESLPLSSISQMEEEEDQVTDKKRIQENPDCWRDQLVTALDTIHQFALQDPKIANDLVTILDQAQIKLVQDAPLRPAPIIA